MKISLDCFFRLVNNQEPIQITGQPERTPVELAIAILDHMAPHLQAVTEKNEVS